MRKTTTEALLGNFSFPPLVLHGDPLAAALIARSPAGTLSLHTLRAALMLNSTRISTILTSMFPEGDGQLSLADFLSMLAALGLHAERVSEPAEVIPALKRALEANGKGRPALLEFICSHHPVHGGWVGRE